jgi:predicted membrane protein
MDRRVDELAVLTAASAMIYGVAFAFDYVIATAVFAALACTIGVIAVTIGTFF